LIWLSSTFRISLRVIVRFNINTAKIIYFTTANTSTLLNRYLGKAASQDFLSSLEQYWEKKNQSSSWYCHSNHPRFSAYLGPAVPVILHKHDISELSKISPSPVALNNEHRVNVNLMSSMGTEVQ
jgi:hypothetical protein